MLLGRALAIGGSIALHVGALAGILLLAASLRQPEPLFVDLTTGDLTTGDLTTGDLTTGHLATGHPAASARAGEERRPAARPSAVESASPITASDSKSSSATR